MTPLQQIAIIQRLLALLRQLLAEITRKKILVIHHGGGPLNFEQVNIYHRRKWNFKSSLGYYIGYHKWLDEDGTLYVARRDYEEAAHTADPNRPHWWNRNSVGLGVQGNYEIDKLDEVLKVKLEIEINKYKARGFKVMMHKQITNTLCPGKHLEAWLKGKV